MLLPLRHVLTRVPLNNGSFQETRDLTVIHVSPDQVDTVTEISESRREEQAIPGRANSIIRYRDALVGYRLYYVEDTGAEIVRRMYRISQGEDPTQPDYAANGGL